MRFIFIINKTQNKYNDLTAEIKNQLEKMNAEFKTDKNKMQLNKMIHFIEKMGIIAWLIIKHFIWNNIKDYYNVHHENIIQFGIFIWTIITAIQIINIKFAIAKFVFLPHLFILYSPFSLPIIITSMLLALCISHIIKTDNGKSLVSKIINMTPLILIIISIATMTNFISLSTIFVVVFIVAILTAQHIWTKLNDNMKHNSGIKGEVTEGKVVAKFGNKPTVASFAKQWKEKTGTPDGGDGHSKSPSSNGMQHQPLPTATIRSLK